MAYLALPHVGEIPLKSPKFLVPLILSIVVIGNLIHRIQRWRTLRHIPGPRLAGFTSLWMTWYHIRGTVHEAYQQVSEQYGPLVRIGPNEVICTDIDALHRISSFKGGYRKDVWYKLGQMTPGIDSVFSTIDPELRRERKKKIAPAYAGKGTDNFEDSVDRAIKAWIESIEQRYANKGNRMDLAKVVHFLALDTLGEVVYSKPLGFIKTNQDMGRFLEINEAALPFVLVLSNYLGIWQLLHKWPFSYALPRSGDKIGLGAVMNFTNDLIEERLRPGRVPTRDVVQSFLNNGLTKVELMQEVTLQFFAGTDTTANAICLTLLFLLTNPHAYRKLQEELEAAEAAGLISAPIRDAEARQLPYLQACMRESLRLMPPLASGAFYKAVPPNGDTVCGHFLPPGTRVATGNVVYATGRMKRFWGEDADAFRPERWIEADAPRREAMTAMGDLIFGHGQFGCLGKQIALMEVGKSIPELLRHYDLSIANPSKPLEIFSAVAWVCHGLWVTVTKR